MTTAVPIAIIVDSMRNMSVDKLIFMMQSFVNPKIEIKNAGSKGIGSFAIAPISKDEVVIVQGGQIVANADLKKSELQPFADHCFQIEKDFHICPAELDHGKMDGVFQVNHSCNPNCGFRGQITLVAMRDIETGEEIVYDYAMTDANYGAMLCKNMKCMCDSVDCRQTITGNDWKLKFVQEKCKGYFSRYIQEMIDEV